LCTPVVGEYGEPLGSFALYRRLPGDNGAADPEHVGAAVHLAGIAIRRERSDQALRSNAAHYRTPFDAMDEAYCVIEMLFDDAGKPADYRFLEVNAAFTQMTGWPRAIGARMRELAPNHEEH